MKVREYIYRFGLVCAIAAEFGREQASEYFAEQLWTMSLGVTNPVADFEDRPEEIKDRLNRFNEKTLEYYKYFDDNAKNEVNFVKVLAKEVLNSYWRGLLGDNFRVDIVSLMLDTTSEWSFAPHKGGSNIQFRVVNQDKVVFYHPEFKSLITLRR